MTIQRIERITSQKKIILEYLKKVTNHPSAEAVYREVKKKLPQISLGTVYRILDSLEKKGEIREINYEISYYDGNVSPHMHLICERCGRILDILKKCDIIECQKLQKVGKIKSYQIFFYGICLKCQK